MYYQHFWSQKSGHKNRDGHKNRGHKNRDGRKNRDGHYNRGYRNVIDCTGTIRKFVEMDHRKKIIFKFDQKWYECPANYYHNLYQVS